MARRSVPVPPVGAALLAACGGGAPTESQAVAAGRHPEPTFTVEPTGRTEPVAGP